MDEFTNWNFFFASSTSDPVGKAAQYAAFKQCVNNQHDPALQLSSAVLTLQRAADNGTGTDGIAMLAKSPNATGVSSSGQNAAIASWAGSTLVYNWVPAGGANPPLYPSPGSILANLFASGNVHPTNAPIAAGSGNAIPFNDYSASDGQIAMQYQDDALITFAQMELTCTPAPVGGAVDVFTIPGDSASNTVPLAAAFAALVIAIATSGWYARRRWLS